MWCGLIRMESSGIDNAQRQYETSRDKAASLGCYRKRFRKNSAEVIQMRAVIIIVVLVLVFVLIGWIRFGSLDGDPAVRVDTEKVKQDTSEMVETSKRAVDGAARKIDASIDREVVEP
ncbi:MAG: hypothetical protein ACF788_12400 [Novipirellula sp. JB048]